MTPTAQGQKPVGPAATPRIPYTSHALMSGDFFRPMGRLRTLAGSTSNPVLPISGTSAGFA